jgi:hypothetical protein
MPIDLSCRVSRLRSSHFRKKLPLSLARLETNPAGDIGVKQDNSQQIVFLRQIPQNRNVTVKKIPLIIKIFNGIPHVS